MQLGRLLVVALGFAIAGPGLSAGAADAGGDRARAKALVEDAELGFVGNSRDELRASIKRVGLMPAELMPSLGDRPDARRALEVAVAHFLAQSGLEVVESGKYQVVFERLNQQAGGIYDAGTGEIKPEVARVVRRDSLQQFITHERLDAVVQISVVPASAKGTGKAARWDYVKDPINDSGAGTLPALSLRVQVFNTQDRLVFARQGGIQLRSYSVPARGFLFPRVPPDELLRDASRIERAARMATLPWIHSARSIKNGSGNPLINAQLIPASELPPLPPQSREVLEPLKVPVEQIRASVKRLAVLPLRSNDFEVTHTANHEFADTARRVLKPLGWEFVDSSRAQEILQAKEKEAGLFDPLTGKLDQSLLAQFNKSLLLAFGADERPDAILWLGVVRTIALQRFGNSEWDGRKVPVAVLGPVARGMFSKEVVDAGTSSLEAASILARMTDSSATLLYEAHGGLALLQGIKVWPGSGRLETVDFFHGKGRFDTDLDPGGVQAALRFLAMTPEALNAELQPRAAGQ